MMIDIILNKLPKINNNELLDFVNLIEQSKKFDNFNNDRQGNNQFELDYANYLGTHNTTFLDTYRQIVIEACHAEFLEWYEYLTKHILRKDVQDLLGISFDYKDNDWENKFRQSNIIGWAFRNNDISIFVDNADKVLKLGNIMIDFFNARKPLSTLDNDYFESDHAQLVLDSIQKIIIDNDMHELKKHLESDKILCMIEVYGWDNRFNPVLLEWICNNRAKVASWT